MKIKLAAEYNLDNKENLILNANASIQNTSSCIHFLYKENE